MCSETAASGASLCLLPMLCYPGDGHPTEHPPCLVGVRSSKCPVFLGDDYHSQLTSVGDMDYGHVLI